MFEVKVIKSSSFWTNVVRSKHTFIAENEADPKTTCCFLFYFLVKDKLTCITFIVPNVVA